MVAPGGEGAFDFDFLAEDEPEEHVEASYSEEKEGCYERKVVDVVRQYGCSNKALNDTYCAQAKVVPENGEVLVKETAGPSDLGQDEEEGLHENEETVQYSPEYACDLIRHGAAIDIVGVCARSGVG